MNYHEFCQEFKRGILARKEWNITEERYHFYPDGMIANGDEQMQEFIRQANARYHGIESDVLHGDFVVINIPAGIMTVDSRYYMQYLYDIFRANDWNHIWKNIQEHMKHVKLLNGLDFDNMIGTYEEAKERLMVRPINYTDNKYILKNHLYKVCGDIALVIYVIMYDDERGSGGFKLQKEYLETWSIDFEELFDEALNNTAKNALPRIYPTPEDMKHMADGRGTFMTPYSDVVQIHKLQSPLVTTTKKMNGAIAMFYPGVKEKLAEMIDGSFYVAFTSIHEAMIHRVGSMKPRRILNCLKGVNRDFPPEELLSRKVFLYDAEEKTFEPLIL